jgi:hypothetical protein
MGVRPVATGMTDDDLEAAVRTFLRDAERAYGEYDQGYADADATLRMLREHLDRLADELD